MHIAISQKNIKLHNFWQSTRNTWCIIELYEKYSSKLFYCSNQHFYHYWFLTSKVIEVESMKSYSIFTATWWTEPSQMMCGKNNPISLHSVYTSAIGKREVSKICQNCWRIVLKNMGEGKGGGDKNTENCWRRLWLVPNANSHKNLLQLSSYKQSNLHNYVLT